MNINKLCNDTDFFQNESFYYFKVCPDEPVEEDNIIPGPNDLKNITKFINGKKTKTIGKKLKPKVVLKITGEPKPLTYLKFKIKKKHLACVKKVIVVVVKPNLDRVSIRKLKNISSSATYAPGINLCQRPMNKYHHIDTSGLVNVFNMVMGAEVSRL